MRWSIMTSTVVLATVLTLGTHSVRLSAQEAAPPDFRSRPTYTPDELAQALFPSSTPPVRTRGIGPAQSSAALPVRPVVTLNVHFASNSDTIPSSAHQDLDKLGTILAWPQYNEYRIELAGHTDNQGSDQLNQVLSARRVQSIKQYLVSNFRLPDGRIATVGYGSSGLLLPTTRQMAEARTDAWKWSISDVHVRQERSGVGKTIAIIVGLGVVLGAGYLFWRGTTPTCPSLAQITAQVQQHPSTQKCANVAVAVEGCMVQLQGRIENAVRRTRLRETIQALPGITQVSDASVQLVGVPFCEVLDILDPLQKREDTLASGLTVKLRHKTGEKIPIYLEDEHFILEITTPLKFASYVYVDYYTIDGQVQHLFPNPQEAANFFAPRSVYVVGQLDEQHIPWKVLPPFGQELLTVITSKQPLVFSPKAPRYDPEPATLYIDQLQHALPRGKVPPEVAVASYLIETRKKP